MKGNTNALHPLYIRLALIYELFCASRKGFSNFSAILAGVLAANFSCSGEFCMVDCSLRSSENEVFLTCWFVVNIGA